MRSETPLVGIDARMWEHPGIGRYIREFSGAMLKDFFPYHLFLLGGDSVKKFSEDKNDKQVSFREAGSKIYSVNEQFEMLSRSNDLDLLHVPHFNVPVFFKKKLVVTIHDLIYLKDARSSGSIFGKAYVHALFKAIEKHADAILTVSDYTKNDLLNSYPKISPDRVFVTPEAASLNFRKINDGSFLDEVKQKYSLVRPFVLFVGSLKAHKNIPTLIKAMARLRDEKKIPHELVLVGRKDMKNSALLSEIEQNTSFVRHLGELPDDSLVTLYNIADLFVLPSFWEGFGLPVLEAMACGAPVITSNRCSLPEVAGEAGLLFDPLRIDALSELIYNVLNNRDLREKMSKAGIERAGHFTWKKTADKTLQVYRRVLG